MKKKIIGSVIATLMFISVLVANVVIKSTQEVKATKDYPYPTACSGSGFCFMEDGWFLYKAIYI